MQRTFPTKRNAREWKEDNAKAISEKTFSDDKRTVQEAAELWIKAVENGRGDNGPAEASTLRQYNYLASLYVIPELGSLKLCDLTKGDVSDFKDRLLKRVSRSLARKCLTALKGILSEAHSQELVGVNVAAKVSVGRAKTERREVVVPEIGEVQAILAELDRRATDKTWRRWRALIATAIHTGMRASEIRGLPWDAVDLREGKVQVRQRADENGKVEEVTKSASGKRTISIPADLVQLLRELKMEAGGHALVFGTKTGKPEALSNIHRRAWHPVQVAAGITDIILDGTGKPKRDADGKPLVEARHNFHSLRHFHASMLIAADTNPKEVQVEMGHADIQTTYNLYGHLFQDKDASQKRSERSERLATMLTPR